jgi:hypothetical protein
MKPIERQKGSRRLNLPVEFPLIDSEGTCVVRCRRNLPDRRKEKLGLADFQVMIAKLAGRTR